MPRPEARCLRCGRPLIAGASIAARLGPKCARQARRFARGKLQPRRLRMAPIRVVHLPPMPGDADYYPLDLLALLELTT